MKFMPDKILVLHGRQAIEIREHVAMESLYAFFKKRDFTSFQSVCGCLSVHRHNVSPRPAAVFADFQAA